MEDPRLRVLLKTEVVTDKRVALIGVPCDYGVARNGGRIGAKGGPDALRSILPKIGTLKNPEYNTDLTGIDVKDWGDVPLFSSLEDMHEKLQATVLKALHANVFPIMIGGGNDQSYPNGAAMIEYLHTTCKETPKIAVINVDAHLDVRPLVNGMAHSGSPFRQILEHPLAKNILLVEFGAQGSQCSEVHTKFVTSHGGEVHWLKQLRDNGGPLAYLRGLMDRLSDRQIFFSFDIDSIRSADCPGVSCPAIVGLTSEEALALCLEAGSRPNVVLMDISEFNPDVEKDRTARLVANMVYYFLMGFSQRGQMCDK